MSYVTHPRAPSREQARKAAERIAAAMRYEMPEYQITVVENLHSRFEVVVEVPFRTESLTGKERANQNG